MASMKQCPHCGKYVPEDRTYCMNCGVTLGIRCPGCRTVMPLGVKTCTACGHSFIKKRTARSLPLCGWMKRNAKPLVAGLSLLCLLLTLVLAAFPGVNLTVLLEEVPFLHHKASGYGLMGFFIGGHPEGITALFELTELTSHVPTLKTLLFLSGLGWLALLCGLIFTALLLICNYKRFGKATARHLFAPLGVALGGIGLIFGLTFPITSILTDGMSKYTDKAEDGYAVATATPMPTVLLVAVVLTVVIHVLLHVFVFSKKESEGEVLIRDILSVPMGALIHLLHRLIRAIRKRAGKRVSERDEPALTVTPRFSTYLILLGVALVFTQALLSKVSNIFFWFVLLLPPVLLIYTVMAKRALTVSMLCDTVTTEKNTPYTYSFRMDNRSILAIPFVEAMVSIPQSNAVRCTERSLRISLAPITGYHVKSTVSFRFRGTYDIGVRCFYVYDFFRILRARVDVEDFTTVYVLPRRLTLDETEAHAVSDDTARAVRSPLVVDKLEVSDIRDYRSGDSLKSIHWKLSSKSESFIVKDYNTGTSNQTVVFCDLTPHFPDEPLPKKEAAEETVTVKKKKPHNEKKPAKSSRKEEARQADDRQRKSKKTSETPETRSISDEDLQARLDQRSAVAEFLNGKTVIDNDTPAETPPPEKKTVNIHELAAPAFYEDMNEYLADGVVELTIASVLAELRKGHEVLLLWFDRRSDTGVFAFPLRDIHEFENVYRLFATAPLTTPDKKVTSLTAMVADMQSAKQMFVVSTMDNAMITDLCGLPGVSDAGSFGSAEVALYNPEERFRYPLERALYLDSCREQLAAGGLSLSVGGLPVPRFEGGNTHEAE